MYTWGYIKDAALAYLEVDEREAQAHGWLKRFPFYANTVITEICSTVKPKHSFVEFKVIDSEEDRESDTDVFVGDIVKMPNDFVSFGDDVCTREWKDPLFYDTYITECHDDDFAYQGYNEIMFFKTGKYRVSYNARWQTFYPATDNDEPLNIPADIIECIPLYIASQCYKLDDEYKASVFRNEYEMAIARIDDTHYKQTKTFTIGGDW